MSATKPLLKSHSSGSLGSMVSAAISSTASIATSPSGSISASSPLFASHSNHHNHHHHHYNQRSARLIRLCCALALFATAIAAVCVLLHWLALSGSGRHAIGGRHLHRGQQPHTAFAPVTLDVRDMPRILLASDADSADERQPNCSHWDCFDVYRCGQAGSNDRMSVYVYPLRQFVDAAAPDGAVAPLSRDFHRVLRAIRESVYYTPDPHEACVFVPSVDLLNQNRVDVEAAGKALATLEYWDNGDNHLLFNMASGTAPHFNTSLDVRTDRAMVAGAGYDTWTYRHAFDLAIPFYRPGLSDARIDNAATSQRPHLLIAAQLNLFARHNRILQELAYDHPNDVLLLQQCRDAAVDNTPKSGGAHASTSGEQRRAEAADGPEWRCAFASQQRHSYPAVLTSGRFCLVARGARLLPLNLMESMAAGCVPVFAADNLVLPFAEILDWTLASVSIRETNLHSIVARLQAISPERTAELRTQVLWLYERYFSSLERVVYTALAQLNDRIFPHVARDQRAWNQPRTDVSTQNPLFLSLTATKAPGFTAVILTYDRVESLFTLIEKLSIVPSLHKILVVWNNQRKAPPHLSQFPKIAKPLQVIRTTANKLSNRFYPYAAIETEALLTIDDDIVMLTADELEFGFEVWREFPDRIVGFPSRTHVWDNTTGRWRYESEWTNEISMVLTGAAFHHKYWSHMYTTAMPGDIKQWVDDHMNCEDIAMNFLVANITGQPPIKVAPRKKFKCPECTNTEMLSADLNHMMERSACIDRFAKIYGRMPLRTVEFRADPVLYKDNFPEKLKRFNDIGSL